MKLHTLPALMVIALATVTACNKPATDDTAGNTTSNEIDTMPRAGIKVAYIYGDSINDKYNFLIDAEAELTEERKRMEDRLRRKLETAEKRAQELQRSAATMTQSQMQDAQLEMQSLELDMQQFQEKLAGDLREREIELQKEYLGRVDKYLDEYNKTAGYDMILNFQFGGNLLWVNRSFDITDKVVEGLNDEYAKELSETTEAAKDKK
jgi:outer membrane protein